MKLEVPEKPPTMRSISFRMAESKIETMDEIAQSFGRKRTDVIRYGIEKAIEEFHNKDKSSKV